MVSIAVPATHAGGGRWVWEIMVRRRAVPGVVEACREAVEDGRRERERVSEAHRRQEQAERIRRASSGRLSRKRGARVMRKSGSVQGAQLRANRGVWFCGEDVSEDFLRISL